jgi:hemerythrin-like domain-containing protein
MPIHIGQRSDHGFDEPLGLLSDCHRRIEHFLDVLATVAGQAADGELTPSWRSALEGAIRYFAVAAPKHTADEEDSLFPRLRGSGDPVLARALASLDALERDHDEADVRHALVDALVRRWLEDGRLARNDADQLRDHLAHLQALYRRHIAVEEQHVFPAAARALDHEQVARIGGEMAARRQVVISRLPYDLPRGD